MTDTNEISKPAGKTHKVRFVVLTVLLAVLIAVSAVGQAMLAATFDISAQAQEQSEQEQDAGEAVGTGIAAAFALVIVIVVCLICAGIVAVAGTICLILSVKNRDSISKPIRIASIVEDVLFGLLLSGSLLDVIVLFCVK